MLWRPQAFVLLTGTMLWGKDSRRSPFINSAPLALCSITGYLPTLDPKWGQK